MMVNPARLERAGFLFEHGPGCRDRRRFNKFTS